MKKFNIKNNLLLLSFFLIHILFGCSSQPIIPDDPKFAPVTPVSMMPPANITGSIYQDGFSTHLWEDKRARRIGDVLTVILEEETSSSKSSSTNVSKDTAINMPEPNVMGATPSIGVPLVPLSRNLTLEAQVNQEREYSGSAGADQNNQLQGQITVSVSQVLPNGLMVVRGEKWLHLTEGDEFIRLTGLVRPTDVRQDNTILSTKIADVRISYSGNGDLANAHKMGWMGRFFNSNLWPF
ncbi:MAG: flagellar basal body L-ring protein FlgH [Pseudomonadota bacterium]